MVRLMVGALSALVITAAPGMAQKIKITEDMAQADLVLKGQQITITRDKTPSSPLDPTLIPTASACPPACITPMQVATDVVTVGELEVIEFLKSYVATGQGLLLDTRTPDGFTKGSIPGALNVPAETLTPKNPYRDEILRALGGVNAGEAWDFSQATGLLMFCDGPWCDDSPRAIRGLIAVGYPASKIQYYRGGMQMWTTLGLTTTDARTQ